MALLCEASLLEIESKVKFVPNMHSMRETELATV